MNVTKSENENVDTNTNLECCPFVRYKKYMQVIFQLKKKIKKFLIKWLKDKSFRVVLTL